MPKPCDLFRGTTDSGGYGNVFYMGRTVKAHRLAYARANGLDVFTMGGVVRHTCDVRRCHEPTHLILGTQADNVQDCVSKGRQPRAPGERNGHAVLTVEDVAEIRKLYVCGCREFGGKALAKRFGITQTQASRIVRGVCW